MKADVPKGWRAYGLIGGLLATVVVVLAVSAPWFERIDATGSETFTPWPFTDADSPSVPDNLFLSVQVAELVLSQEWVARRLEYAVLPLATVSLDAPAV